MKNTQTERQTYQITPFIYENHAVITVVIEKEPCFIAHDVGKGGLI